MAGILATPTSTIQQPVQPATTVQAAATPTATSTVNLAQANAVTPAATQQAAAPVLSVNPATDTVAGQANTIIAADSPLMQRAAAKANEASNAKGLLNSSMAVGAAQGAVMDAATPIAQADANANRATALANADMQKQTDQFNAQQQNAMNTTSAQLQTQVNQSNTQASNSVTINQLDQANKIQLANIQATYQGDMQANQGSSTLFNTTMSAINNIQQSTTMDAATKQASINQQVSLLKSGLALQGSIANLNLTGVLNFAV